MIKTTLTLAVIALLAFTGTALAAGAAAPEDGNLLDLARPVYDAIMAGHYWLAAASALVLLVAAARRYGARIWAPLGSGTAGAVMVLVGSFAGAMATALAAGAAPSWSMLRTALGVAVSAAGGFALLQSIGLPLLRALVSKFPPLAPLLKLAEWVLTRPDPVEEAEAAGDAAVAAKPPTGAAGVTGAPRDWP